MGAPSSVVHSPSTFSKNFSSKTIGQISFKFHMQPPDKGGKKVYTYNIFGLGHMTKMDSFPYIVNPQKTTTAKFI